VLALDLRGTGETAPGTPPPAGRPDYLGVDFGEAYLAIHLARPLLGQRVLDLLSVVEAVAPVQNSGFEVIAVGSPGPVALHAAALDPRIKQVTVADSVVSWSAVACSPVSQNQLTNAVPGVLKVYDLPDLGRLIAPRPLTIRAATDPSGKPVSQQVMEAEYAPTIDAFRQANMRARLLLKAAL
jgi:pimeloyl-ACP methyl ester carboxylesterase